MPGHEDVGILDRMSTKPIRYKIPETLCLALSDDALFALLLPIVMRIAANIIAKGCSITIKRASALDIKSEILP